MKITHSQLAPVITATQEAEISRITVQSQPQAYSSRDPIMKKTHHKKRDGGAPV
jgi:hypothetical protein